MKQYGFSYRPRFHNPSKIDNSRLPDTELKPLLPFENIFCDRTEELPPAAPHVTQEYEEMATEGPGDQTSSRVFFCEKWGDEGGTCGNPPNLGSAERFPFLLVEGVAS